MKSVLNTVHYALAVPIEYGLANSQNREFLTQRLGDLFDQPLWHIGQVWPTAMAHLKAAEKKTRTLRVQNIRCTANIAFFEKLASRRP